MTALATEALQFLRSTRKGILSTHAVKYPGYPFGSVAPFVTNHQAEPILLISSIAEHTKNIQANPKVSLVVFAGEEDLQANARLTLLGEAIPCSKDDPLLKARYLRYHPQATSYFDMHDFAFYRIQIQQARYIAGFGRMGWLEGHELCAPDLLNPTWTLAEEEQSIVDHMNTDHQANLIAYCQHVHGIEAHSAEMIGLDQDGFDIRAVSTDQQTHTLRFHFRSPVIDAQSARVELVALAKASRS